MFLYNYGACAVFFKEKTYTVNLSDYVYHVEGTTLYLDMYVGQETNISVPVLE